VRGSDRGVWFPMPSRDFRSLAPGSLLNWVGEAKGYVDHAGGFLKRFVTIHVRRLRRYQSGAKATSDSSVSLSVG
jgi:hypothetical protein